MLIKKKGETEDRKISNIPPNEGQIYVQLSIVYSRMQYEDDRNIDTGYESTKDKTHNCNLEFWKVFTACEHFKENK